MKQTFYERIGESVYREVLPNGLQVCVVPKPEHAKKYAFFATRYGGMDTRFCLDGKWLDTPAGIAHYLEHKMFDTKEGNALQELAKNGAEPNAFTSNAMTGYYFDSTEHFEENLEILLSFVSIPYFTEESVAKEQGIIGQEIRMIEDNPDWQLYTRMMQALYQKSTARTSIAGTVESISTSQRRRCTTATGILHPLQHDFDSGGQRGSGPCGGPGPADPTPGGWAGGPPGLRPGTRPGGGKGDPHGHGGLCPSVPDGLQVRPGGGRGGLPPYRRSGRHGLRHPAGGFQPPVPAAL